MTDYRTMQQQVLFELLSTHTADYTKLLTENGNPQQLDDLEKKIIALQKEIHYRKKLDEYKGASTDYIYSSDGDLI